MGVRKCVNKQRRTKLSDANSLLNRAVTIVELVKDEEQDSYDNLPENLQDGERGEAMQEAIDELQIAIDSINDAMNHIDCAKE